MKILRHILLLSPVAFALSLAAQDAPVFNNAADYDAWKAQFATPDQPGPTHPSEQAAEEDHSRGGSATCDCWITPDASYTTINNNTEWNAGGWGNGDDGSYGPINLPFGVYMYGQTYSTAYININGSVSFGNYLTGYSSSAFPMSGPTLVAPFWADVDLRGGGVNNNIVQFKVTPTALYVNWTRVGYYSMQTDTLASIEKEHARAPFWLVLWDLECPYCMKSLSNLAAAQRRDPHLKIVTISTDPLDQAEEIAARLAQLGVRSEAYAFGDAPREALQFAIDPGWLGEKPRAYRYDAAGQREAISGVIQLPTALHRNP